MKSKIMCDYKKFRVIMKKMARNFVWLGKKRPEISCDYFRITREPGIFYKINKIVLEIKK